MSTEESFPTLLDDVTAIVIERQQEEGLTPREIIEVVFDLLCRIRTAMDAEELQTSLTQLRMQVEAAFNGGHITDLDGYPLSPNPEENVPVRVEDELLHTMLDRWKDELIDGKDEL